MSHEEKADNEMIIVRIMGWGYSLLMCC